MQMKTLRKAHKAYNGASAKLTRADVEAYVAASKDYLTTPEPGYSGLCNYASRHPKVTLASNIHAYSIWSTLSDVRGSVAKDWEVRRVACPHRGGRTPDRIKMVEALIAELTATIEQDKRKR
jgi:hypothetical protein